MASERARNLALRLATAAVLVPVLLWLLFWGPPAAFLAVGLLATGAAGWELGAMVPDARAVDRLWTVLASVGLAAGWRLAPSVAVVHVVGLAVVVGAVLLGLGAASSEQRAAARAGWLLGGPLYVGATMAALLGLHAQPHGGRWVVLAMTLAWIGDTSAYAAGLTMGRRKLAPRLSPKKTVEGAVGGLLGSLAAALFAAFVYLPELPAVAAVLLGLLGGAAGQAGDLFESLLKRAAGLKDSGRLLPGHGGLLDRIDALLVTASATWAFVVLRALWASAGG